MSLARINSDVWARLGFSVTRNKRIPRLTAAASQAEHLETRQLLSVMRGGESNTSVAHVAPADSAGSSTQTHAFNGLHQVRSRVAPTYPNVKGTWNLQAAADIDDDPTLNFIGTVLLEQKGRTITGKVDLEGLPSFKIKGKLDKVETSELSGFARFPIEASHDRFYFLRGRLAVTFAQDVTQFTGQVHRDIFGHHINITLTATKK